MFDSPRQALRRRGRAPARGSRRSIPTARDRDRPGCGRGRAGRATGYRGGALNLAARLCSLAGGGGDPRQRDGSDPRARRWTACGTASGGSSGSRGCPGRCRWSRSFHEDRRVRKLTLRRLRRQARGIARSRRGQLIAAAVARGGSGRRHPPLALAGGSSVAGARDPAELARPAERGRDMTGKIPVGGNYVYAVHGAGGFWAVDDSTERSEARFRGAHGPAAADDLRRHHRVGLPPVRVSSGWKTRTSRR